MVATRLHSSVLATAVGGFVVLAAFTASSITQPGSEVGKKGDRLTTPTKISCKVDCVGTNERIERAFQTFAEHDSEAGVTTLIRVYEQAQ